MSEDGLCNHLCGCPNYCETQCENPKCCDYSYSAIKEAPKVTSRDPNSYIQASAQTLAETLASKNSDYAPTGEFSNFEKSAEMVGGGMDALSVMLVQVGIKVTRIESIRQNVNEPTNFESLKDSLLDLAGYATIAHAYLEYVGSPTAMDQYQEASTELRETMENGEPPIPSGPMCPHRWERIGADYYRCNWCNDVCLAEAFND